MSFVTHQDKMRERTGKLTTRAVSSIARQFKLMSPITKELPLALPPQENSDLSLELPPSVKLQDNRDLSLPDMSKITNCQKTKEKPNGWEERAKFFRTMTSSNV